VCNYPKLLAGCVMNKFFFNFTLYLLTLTLTSCDDSEITLVNPEKYTPNKLYAYSNHGNIVHLIDYKTFEVVKEIQIDIASTRGLFGITVSSNKDYLVFSGMDLDPPFEHFITSYNINDGVVHTFATGFDSVGAPRLAPAYDYTNPGLIFFYSHSIGFYLFNFLEMKVVQCISEEHDQSLGVHFYNTPSGTYTAVLKNYPSNYSAIEFYQQGSSLQNLLFVFNDNDEYEMSIYDVDFSDNDEFMYLSYQLSEKRSREIESYFGIYDLINKQLFKSEFTLPWSLNPYYIEYIPKRKEAYLVGIYDQFYIVNTDSNALVDSVTITGKVDGPSRILTDPDEDVAFVSCSRNDKIVVIDLDSRQVIESIQISSPYKMIIP
jgi:hypothetical protein